MKSLLSQWLMALTAAASLVVGAPLFVLPTLLAPSFPWSVSPFVAMTIGAWCLGNAWLAGVTSCRRKWSLGYAGSLYLLLFGVLELSVVAAFRAKFVLSGPLAWGYLAALAASAVAGLVGTLEWLRRRPQFSAPGPNMPRSARAAVIAFVVFVGFLGVYGLLAQPGWPATNGGVFPEMLTPFTLRSFAAFYFSLAIGVVPFLLERSLAPLLQHSFASYGLIVTITFAALANLGVFDFAERPGGLLYIGAYLLVGIPVGLALLKLGTGIPRDVTAAEAAAPS